MFIRMKVVFLEVLGFLFCFTVKSTSNDGGMESCSLTPALLLSNSVVVSLFLSLCFHEKA